MIDSCNLSWSRSYSGTIEQTEPDTGNALALEKKEEPATDHGLARHRRCNTPVLLFSAELPSTRPAIFHFVQKLMRLCHLIQTSILAFNVDIKTDLKTQMV